MTDVEGAIAQARDAATAAGVVVRPLTLEECGTAAALLAGLWGVPPVGLPVLVALHRTGHYVAGAFVGPELVGVCVGIVSAPGERGLHSHVTGVLPELAGHGARGVHRDADHLGGRGDRARDPDGCLGSHGRHDA